MNCRRLARSTQWLLVGVVLAMHIGLYLVRPLDTRHLLSYSPSTFWLARESLACAGSSGSQVN
jgi:hypothetical protein